MKILYAVQATGNGHISRAIQLLPYLEEYGKVDVFLSGSNSQLATPLPVKYRSKGLSLFYNHTGGLHYTKIWKEIKLASTIKEIRSLPVEKYDFVLNDFECLTSLACALKRIPSANFGHQASFKSKLAPRPEKKDRMGEWLLQNYARASQYVGLHFKPYDHFIFPPVIKKEILEADPTDRGHITVYLSAYSDTFLLQHFNTIKDRTFHVFSKAVGSIQYHDNVILMPVQQQLFNESMIHAHGIITGAGFETPAEAMHLQKKLMVIPIQGQYEQHCNAAALQEFGIRVLPAIDKGFSYQFHQWLAGWQQEVYFDNIIPQALEYVFGIRSQPETGRLLYPELILN